MRTYVRLMVERAVTASDASNLALLIGRASYVLYDTKEVGNAIFYAKEELYADPPRQDQYKRAFLGAVETELLHRDCVLGYMSVKRPGGYYGAAVVATSAAKKGYGPLLYDIVMETENGLTGDRDEVSTSAMRVWSFYATRSDIERKPIDDIYDPQTPPDFDDGELFARRTKDHPLNYVYFKKTHTDVSKLLANHEKICSEFEETSFPRKHLEDLLIMTGDEYFSKRYNE